MLEVLDYGFNIDREYNYVSGGLSEKVMYSEDGGVGVYYNNTGIFDIGESEELDISEKEFAGKMSKYRDRCVTLSWTPIGQYRGDGNTDNDEQTGNREQITDDDPLEGLVSNDILVKFRESNSVKDPESVENEALMFGRWVQKNIGKIPKSVREKGDEIGRRYEFWFGTDVGNNFDSNFPMIYEAYYCLKDYYTSDGKRSRDFYERVSEGNDFISNGDPENIEKMFSDMRDFITDCNNIIRKK